MKNKNASKMISFQDYQGSYGAVIGDIVGSHYEFLHGPKEAKESAILFHPDSCVTDDSVLTVAVADYLLHMNGQSDATETLHRYARAYPNAGYGGRFRHWMHSDHPEPYNSFGNGSAMRVSAVAYFAKNKEDVYALSDIVTCPTHNHPEGIKGARVTAMAIYMALHGASKEEIAEYALAQYPSIAKLNYDEMVAYLGHGDEICQVTVPQALWAFLHSESFEDCLRTCVAIRWDCDTLAAIACPIAEAYYKEIPLSIFNEAMKRIPDEFKKVLGSIPK